MMPTMEEASVGALVKMVPTKVCVPQWGWDMQRQQPRSSTSNPKCANRSSVSCSVWLEWAAKNCTDVARGEGGGGGGEGAARLGGGVHHSSQLSLKWDQ